MGNLKMKDGGVSGGRGDQGVGKPPIFRSQFPHKPHGKSIMMLGECCDGTADIVETQCCLQRVYRPRTKYEGR